MTVTLQPGKICGKISAIPSKSHLHRLLIFASFADGPTEISCRETNAEDIKATIDCLAALGAKIEKTQSGYNVIPVNRNELKHLQQPVVFPCGESGSTLRFMLPIICALGIRGVFEMKGRLPQRPLAPLDEQLKNHGIRLWHEGVDSEFLHCDGQLTHGGFALPGDISSQYVTGLLMALPLLKGASRLVVSAPVESLGYIEITHQTAKNFGKIFANNLDPNKNIEYEILPNIFKSPGRTEADGDWSNSAFWACAGAMPGSYMQISGLLKNSTQGDREICDVLQRMGANVSWDGEILCVRGEAESQTFFAASKARCDGNAAEAEARNRDWERSPHCKIDARPIPDLIPVISAVAAINKGTTIIENAARLRIKESDRLMSTAQTLSALGADIKEASDGLIIRGVPALTGGTVHAHGDHRIAMTAAIASSVCTNPVIINGAEAVNKSYPKFWEDLHALRDSII